MQLETVVPISLQDVTDLGKAPYLEWGEWMKVNTLSSYIFNQR